MFYVLMLPPVRKISADVHAHNQHTKIFIGIRYVETLLMIISDD